LPIKYQNQSDYAFLAWISQHPESGHPLDHQRFLRFAKTVCVYGAKRWLDYKYFKARVITNKPYIRIDLLERLHERLLDFQEFYEAHHYPSYEGTGEAVYFQEGVIDNKRYSVKISEFEYAKGGASKETLKKATYF